MRTNIEIDDGLMRKAIRITGARTKKATVEAGLRKLISLHEQGTIRKLRGKVAWKVTSNSPARDASPRVFHKADSILEATRSVSVFAMIARDSS